MRTLNKKMTGKFITIEGIDGAGKSASVATVVSAIQDAGIQIVTTREPGGTSLGEELRKIILQPESKFCVEAEILTIFAARAQHLHELVLPAIEKGQWVLCDRFTDSTYAYQGGGRNFDSNQISIIEDWLQKEFRPDLTILMDAHTETGQARIRNSSEALDRFELENYEFHERVRQTFRTIARNEPDRVKVIDANQSEAEVRARARKLIDDFLVKWNG